MKACWSLMWNPRKSGYACSMASFRTISSVDSSSSDTPFCIWKKNVDHIIVWFTSKNKTPSPPKHIKFASNSKTSDSEWRRDGVFTQSKKTNDLGVYIVPVNITKGDFPFICFWHKTHLLIGLLYFVSVRVYAEYIVRLCYRILSCLHNGKDINLIH